MQQPFSPFATVPGPLQVVIDTQSLLDWRLFADPICATWSGSHKAGHWKWRATPDMRAELSFVLAREFVTRWAAPAAEVLEWFDHHAVIAPPPAPDAARGLTCSDRSDQKFIDLAVHLKADWLISRDRAVLKLARRAHQLHGLKIATPRSWSDALHGLPRP
jgi:predicted nucleic acid-binding protein